ncbi:hypothetical protein B0H10DRAFT_2127910, partial [Mycena sp. CBHHK59/15]
MRSCSSGSLVADLGAAEAWTSTPYPPGEPAAALRGHRRIVRVPIPVPSSAPDYTLSPPSRSASVPTPSSGAPSIHPLARLGEDERSRASVSPSRDLPVGVRGERLGPAPRLLQRITPLAPVSQASSSSCSSPSL